jgi:hypothetical protein
LRALRELSRSIETVSTSVSSIADFQEPAKYTVTEGGSRRASSEDSVILIFVHLFRTFGCNQVDLEAIHALKAGG